MTMTDTLLALIDSQARVLNTLRTWGHAQTGMRCSALIDAAEVEILAVIALEERGLITAHDETGAHRSIHYGTPGYVAGKLRIRFTDKGKLWVESPPNMLLREIASEGRAGLDLCKAMELAGDTRIIRWAVEEEGYATLHAADNDVELRLSRKGVEFLSPQHFTLRPTRKIPKRTGS